MDQIKRQEHLALYSPLNLVEFCAEFKASLYLPEMQFDYENETEWAEVEFENINYNVSRPFAKGKLSEWDSSVPVDCNFGISLGILKTHPSASDPKWIMENLVTITANRLAFAFNTSVHYHRTWLSAGRNEEHNICYK